MVVVSKYVLMWRGGWSDGTKGISEIPVDLFNRPNERLLKLNHMPINMQNV